MRNLNRISLALLTALAAGVLLGCKTNPGISDTWKVIFISLPETIRPDAIQDGDVSYVLHQTHEPLFRQEDGQNFKSNVLSRWSRSIDYSEYEFCPNTALKFNSDKTFSPEMLYSHLLKITGGFDAGFRIQMAGECSVIKFSSGKPGFLGFLSEYANAPSAPEGSISYGLGPFRITSVSRDSIELSRRQKVRNGYNKIVAYPYAGPKDPRLMDRGISDFNNLSSFQQPAWLSAEFNGFDNIELRVGGLLLNHPDPRVRKVLYNCVDVDEFRRAVVPARKDFYDVGTLLPVGVPGGKAGRPVQTCAVPKELAGTEVVFVTPRTDNKEQLASFAERFNRKTGFRLKVRHLAPEEVNRIGFGKSRRPYTMLLVMSENSRPEQSGFLGFYAGDERLLDFVPETITEQFVQLKKENYPDRKKVLAEKLVGDIGTHHLALPLYQTFVRLYYPPGIKNLSVGRGFVEIPDVGNLRW